jgi:hypothetical protein
MLGMNRWLDEVVAPADDDKYYSNSREQDAFVTRRMTKERDKGYLNEYRQVHIEDRHTQTTCSDMGLLGWEIGNLDRECNCVIEMSENFFTLNHKECQVLQQALRQSAQLHAESLHGQGHYAICPSPRPNYEGDAIQQRSSRNVVSL